MPVIDVCSSAPEADLKSVKGTVDEPDEHRTSCHRCGNLRKKKTLCKECPYVFCSKCTEKMKIEHGRNVFEKGCPVVSFAQIFLTVLTIS